MSTAALGFRAHSGWCSVVALTLEHGKPVVLLRERLQLVEIFDYQFRQPYHTAEKMDRDQGRDFVAQMRRVSGDLAYQELRRVQEHLSKRKVRLRRCALLVASGRPLPAFEQIMASHPLLHTADGELFRDALEHAAIRCKLPVLRVKEKDVVSEAAKLFELTPAALLKRAKNMGRGLGAPWSQDEKYAALAAWMALSNGSKNRAR
jgi:hypothetical protein